jgi:hypothetical protein
LLGLTVDTEATVEPKQCPPLVIIRDGSKDRHGRRRVSLVDRWGARRIGDITDADIIDVLDQISRHPIAANRLHAVLSAFFGWAKDKRLVASNPCTGLRRPAAATACSTTKSFARCGWRPASLATHTLASFGC